MGPFDVSWMVASVGLATPLVFAATGELISERAGVLNIGLEGMILSGAFFAFYGERLTHSMMLGILSGLIAGVATASIMALLSVQFRADQIVVGVGINLLALGVTTFSFRESSTSQSVHLEPAHGLPIPGLASIPVVGPALFDQTALGYLAFLLVPTAWMLLYRTNWGLAIRAVGEVPASGDTAGISVAKVRWLATLCAGGLAGLGGAFLSIGVLGSFVEGMSAGRGFLALAAVIFGGWNPWGVFAACLLFGGADALQLRLQAYESVPRQVWLVMALLGLAYLVISALRKAKPSPSAAVSGGAVMVLGVVLFLTDPSLSVPTQLWLILPYLFALLAMAGLVRRVRMPAALAIPHRRAG